MKCEWRALGLHFPSFSFRLEVQKPGVCVLSVIAVSKKKPTVTGNNGVVVVDWGTDALDFLQT